MRHTRARRFVGLAAVTAALALPSPSFAAPPPPPPPEPSAPVATDTTPAPSPPGRAARPGARILTVGARGRDVRFVETHLRGYAPGRVDGRFDRRLKRAVGRFQATKRLAPDGVVGARTWRALGVRPTLARAAKRAGKRPRRSSAPARTAVAAIRAFPLDPAATFTRTRNFGEQRGGHVHEGEDILADRGVAELAVDDAVIAEVAAEGDNGGRGRYVELRRADGTEFVYYHLDTVDPALAPGIAVTAGQRLGTVGDSGRASATHLHFEVHVGGRPVDPAPYLDAVQRTGSTAPAGPTPPPEPPPA